MSESYTKEECGENFTQGISDSMNEDVEVMVKTEMNVDEVIKTEMNVDEVMVKTEMNVEPVRIKDDDKGNNDSNENELEESDKGTNDSNESELEENERGTNDSNESKLEEKAYVNAIRNTLGIVAMPGTFACGGVLAKAKLQLSVNGVGKIKLPLSNKQGAVLKSKCTAAPFGRGTETLVHKLVRDAWQVDAKHISLDKEFNKLIKEKVAEIIPTLMGESFTETQQIESELYKLVYYEKDGHFIAHRDTEKGPGMFGTLVVQLPAAHRGGALEVRHKGETKVFDFEDDFDDDSDSYDASDDCDSEDDSRENFFFTAFFADCEHELRTITAGHRLVLIYNLVRKNPHSTLHPRIDNNINPSNNNNFMTTMRNAVEEWKSDNKGPQYLALKLDHLYTNTNTSFKNLKGKDKNIADALCSCADIEVYLATITKNEKRFGYEDDPVPRGCKPDLVPEDEVETVCSYILDSWIGVNNKKPPFGKLEIHANEMLLKEEYMFQKYEERCNSKYEYTGNEGCNINYFYKKKALLFWPKSHGILIYCDKNLNSVLDNCKKLSKSKKDDALEMLKGILLYIEKKHERAMSLLQDGHKVASIFEIMILFEDTIKTLANTFLLSLVKPYRSDEYCWRPRKKKVGLPSTYVAIALANLINKLSWESLGNSVLQLVKECAVSQTVSCAQLVSSLLSLGLKEHAINVVEVAAPLIIAQMNYLCSENGGAWVILLASNDIFCTYFDDFVKEISKMRGHVLIEIIAQMHRSLKPKVINQNRIKQSFQTLLSILHNNGWKNLSVKSVTLLWPVVLFVDKFYSEVSLLYNFVQAIIKHKDSSNFLEALLKFPNVVEAKDTPSVQLMVQKRLQQLDVSYPVFSWAQPNAKLEMSFTCFGGPDLKDVNKFLRSDKETKTFGNVFFNKTEANQYGKEYFQTGEYNKSGKYSARYELSGKGRNVECKIIKTKDYFDAEVKMYNLMCEEAKVLKKKFVNQKIVSQKRARE